MSELDERMKRDLEELIALRARVSLLEGLLEKHGYDTAGELVECRECGGYGELPTHAPDCELAKALRKETG